jgi:hypothetical protein
MFFEYAQANNPRKPDSYDVDYIRREHAEQQVRIMAFGAIRRAAQIAREHDQRAAFFAREVLQNATPEGLNCDDRLLHVETGAQSIWDHVTSARAVRRAIRAAIGSEKA